MRKIKKATTPEKASTYDTTMPFLRSMYTEFKDLSKKKPDTAVSKSKIKIANRLLTKLQTVLIDEEFITFLDLVDEDAVPQVSDVTLILSQYVVAMKEFRSKYSDRDGLYNEWAT